MKIFKDPKGLKLKPCLNCVPTPKRKSTKVFDPLAHHNLLDFERLCPCSNHTGEIHREIEQGGKVIITEFSCESRKMHEGFPNGSETSQGARGAKQRSKASQSSNPKTR